MSDYDDDATNGVSRRHFLLGLSAATAASTLGCGDADPGSDTGTPDSSIDASGDSATADAAVDALSDAAADAPSETGGLMTLSNFRTSDTDRSRIYFDASSSAVGLSTQGFVIQGKTIGGVTPDESGGYFTLSADLDYWDNVTIRLEGGDGTVEDFTLEYVENQIAPPAFSGAEFYVTTSGDDGNDGLTEAAAFATLGRALSGIRPNDKVWIRAGIYNDEHIDMPSLGTASAPIWIEGYKSSPGDITSNYYRPFADADSTTSAALDASEMPTFDGGDRTSAGETAFNLVNASYIFVKNLQLRNYYQGIRGQNTNNVVYENINLRGFGDANNFGGIGFMFNTFNTTSTNNRFINIVSGNATAGNMYISSSNSLIENLYSFCDELDPDDPTGLTTDYYLQIQGDNNTIRNSICDKRIAGFSHFGHAFIVKYNGEYNLFELNESINIMNSFHARHSSVAHNVWKDSEARGDVSYASTSWTGGVVVTDGAHHNVFERLYIHDVKFPFDFEEATEDETSIALGSDNIFRNIIVDNAEAGLRFRNDEAGAAPFDNNQFDHITWNNIESMFVVWNTGDANGTVSLSGNTLSNCIFSLIGEERPSAADTDFTGISGFTFSNNGYHNAFPAKGSDSIEADPQFDADWVPGNAAYKMGVVTPTKTGFVRTSPMSEPPTIGARQMPS